MAEERQLTLAELLQKMEEEMGQEPKPMKLLAEFLPQGVFRHAGDKQFAFGLEKIPGKYKLLTSIAVAAALGSERCTATYTRGALDKGVTKEEIAEILWLARFVKAATVISAAVPALELLHQD